MRRGHEKSRHGPRRVPTVWLMTDERVSERDLMRAIGRLPPGSAIVVRHYSLAADARRDLFSRIRRAGRRRGAHVLLAGEAALARDWGADGHHGRVPRGRKGGRWLHSAPAHDRHELVAARRAGADALLVSPLFATRSHPGARALGVYRFAALARVAHAPVIALGGVKPRHAGLVRRLGAAGYAAIDGLVRRWPKK